MTVIPLFAPGPWQMSRGERAAIEGTLAALRPALAIEIGTAQGGALERIAAYSQEVHSFDLVPPEIKVLDHVTLHPGDSHVLLPAFLAELARDGRKVDFALVDGDHFADGVRRDVEDLLASPAVERTVVVLHDTVNEEVRAGLDAIRWDPKVSYVDLDWVPGHLWAEEYLRNELWGGLGLVLVDPAHPGTVHERQYRPTPPLLALARERILADGGLPPPRRNGELARVRAELDHVQRTLSAITASPSWRLTAPLRAAKARMRRR